MSTGQLIALIFGIIVVLFVFYVIGTYNALISLRNRVKNQWAQIDVQLKRRFDLIPNLVETVKGYAKHESETFESVIKARNSYLSANTPEAGIEASGELTQAIGRLFALSESYPELKANTNFIQMQNDLKEIEATIASSRTFYNDTVLMFNKRIEMFPSNMIAGMFGFKIATFFEVEGTERENVTVKF